MLMEYLPHGDLLGWRDMELPVILSVLSQCLDCLVYLHGQRVMHRDIKADNIGIQSLNPLRVKLLDFGEAREGRVANSMAGAISHLAPEAVHGKPYTHLVDVWSLGLTVLEVMTRLPKKELARFKQQHTSIKHFEAYVGAIHRKRRILPEPLPDLVKGMLEYDPRHRWSAKECLSRVETIREGMGSCREQWLANPQSIATQARHPARARRHRCPDLMCRARGFPFPCG
jgi:serine/threonine protein kinase